MAAENGFIEKCKNFANLVNLNGRIRPNVIVMGLNAIVNADMSEISGSSPLRCLLSNKLTLSSLHPTGYRFGLFLTNKPENESRGRVEAYVETDVEGHISGKGRYDMSKNIEAKAWGQWTPSRADVTGLIEWADRGFSTRVAGRMRTENVACGKNVFSVVLDQVFRLSDRWTAGGQVTLGLKDGIRHQMKPPPPPSLPLPLPNETVVDCVSVLQWDDGESNTMAATVNKAIAASLMYQRRINNKLTVGAELAITDSEVKTTWMHSIQLENNLVITGQVSTDGTVVGNIRKRIMTNFSVGIGTALNHSADRFGVGIEMVFGPSLYGGSSPSDFRL